jgi:hypothetical protein
MFLANCDPVRRLSVKELEKRFLLGVTFADGVIVTPSLLLDNKGFAAVLDRKNLVKWYREEGNGGFVVRLPGAADCHSMLEYFDALPPNHVLAGYGGKTKGSLSRPQLIELRRDLDALDQSIRQFEPTFETVGLERQSLSNGILKRPALAEWLETSEEKRDSIQRLLERKDELGSRSEWYAAVDSLMPQDAVRFKTEVIDTAYHALFVGQGEAFAMDRIQLLDGIPAPILDTTVAIRSLRNEFEYIGYATKAFEIVTSFGSIELMKLLTDEALGYLEGKAQDKGMKWATRKNWFGLYPRLAKAIGVELR